MSLGAIILTGGGSSRMGTDKAQVVWFGRRAVDRAADLARHCQADPIITVGATDYGIAHVPDAEPHGGPVGGILTGVGVLGAAGCRRALVLAVDAPMLLPEDLDLLLAVAGPGAAYDGLHLPMVLEVAALPEAAMAGWPLGRLVERAGLERLACPPDRLDRLRGANTPRERDALIKRLESGQ